jgi:hypothetical protein
LLLFILALLFPPLAAASFEEVTEFGDTGPVAGPHEYPVAQLFDTKGAAVNYTGAGGVAPGTLYVARKQEGSGGGGVEPSEGLRLYGPQGEFLEEWAPIPKQLDGSSDKELEGVAVDETTGDVYVLLFSSHGEASKVLVYTPNGTQLTTFGTEIGKAGESVAEDPSKIGDTYPSGIAVDGSGAVYISDFHAGPNFETRVMVFEPEAAGDYEHYKYAGVSHDIAESSGDTTSYYVPAVLAVDAAGNLYMAESYSEPEIVEFNPADPDVPVCRYRVPGRGQDGLTVDPLTGEVFYWSYKHPQEIFQLNPCNAEGNFTLKTAIHLNRAGFEIKALAFDPTVKYSPNRPPGMLYAFSNVQEEGNVGSESSHAYGLIAAPAEFHLPVVESESVLSVGSSTANIGAKVNPEGFPTSNVFQYETEAQYEANQPDEVQSLTVSADGGLFSLGFGGRRYGGSVVADLAAGSTSVTSLTTAKGSATFHAAKGTATLKAVSGTGTVVSNSKAVVAVTANEKGVFEVGESISGQGIPPATKITAVKAGELTISNSATSSGAGVSISAGQLTLSSLVVKEGAFEVGQAIEGEGIPNGATITKVEASALVISAPPTKAGTAVSISAGSPIVTGVTLNEGEFVAGQGIEGAGIPKGTVILSVTASELRLSKPVTKPGSGVPIEATGPAPLVVGQAIEGPGIPPGTVIEKVSAGEVVLSQPAQATQTAVSLDAGLPFDAPAGRIRDALESLPAIGEGGVEVSGGPGDESGSSPYAVRFTGPFSNTNINQEVEADSLGLSGGSASVVVSTTNQGGDGFQGASEVPPGGAELGSGNVPVSASVGLSGLLPDTAYRFRAVATSHCDAAEEQQVCEGVGAPKAFHTFAAQAPGLPDHRAWEMVSPPVKEGGEVWPAEPGRFSHGCQFCKPGVGLPHFPIQSAPDGEAVVYQGFPFSGTEGNGLYDQYLSRRGSSGWETDTVSPRQLGAEFKAFGADLSAAVVEYETGPPLSPQAPAGYSNLYAESSATGVVSPLITAPPPNRNSGQFEVRAAGGSANYSTLFFEANDALTAETASSPASEDPGQTHMNVYEWSGGALSLVNVLPGNAATVPGVLGSGFQLGGANPNYLQPVTSHAISEDGHRAFWSDEAGQLYVREDGTQTTEIPDHSGKFLTAAADGSKVLLSDGVLYDLETEESSDLTESEGFHRGGFEGLVGQSADLSRLYYVDSADLTGGEENAYGAQAQAGKHNLYAWHEGSVAFVAVLSSGDDWEVAPQVRTAEASPDGRWLTFVESVSPLTGQDNTGLCRELGSGSEEFGEGPCQEVYVYDSASGELTCASCNPSGKAALGGSTLETASSGAPSPQPRYLTNEGRVYFDSQDSLSLFDTNEGVEDVYEWEPKGVGTCESASVGAGCVSLISAGHEPVDSNLMAVDESGKNVFFTTRDQLVLKDTDDALDLYDAREGGGIPAEDEVARTECQGEACQAPTSAPNDPTPASSAYEGPGNVKEHAAPKKSGGHHRKHHAKKHRHRHKSKAGHRHRAAKRNHGGAK